KPGNIGAVLRTADGAGASDCLLADPKTDVYNPNAIRASLGTIFAFQPAAAPSGRVIERLLELEIDIFAARVEGACDYDAVDFTGPCAIVLGSEADGLTRAWNAAKIRAVRIPMLGRADSLNVSAAAAVLLYEARRQRRARGIGS
ncbi:MAG: RNA methyltransferase, partial [Planctomycetota bacterium]